MRKTLVVLLSSGAAFVVGLFLIGFYSSCGSTGGAGSSVAEIANQFVSLSCAPGGSRCLTLTGPGTVPADGKTLSGFRAELRDGSGAPIDNVKICFNFEDPDVAIIIEPTDNCGLTAPDGHVSGQFRDGTRTGSFVLIADAPPGFGLEARTTVKFTGVSPAPGQKGDIGSTCQSDQDCNTAPVKLFCTFNDRCFPGGTTCQATQGAGGCCTSGQECDSSTCNTTTGQCTAVNGGTGAPCVSNTDCDQNLFCSFGDTCFPGGSVCRPTGAAGACCTNDSECASGTCNTATSQCAAVNGGTGSPCVSDTDCNSNLFCSFGDTCPFGNSICQPRQTVGGCCTTNSECSSNRCGTGANECLPVAGTGGSGDPCVVDGDCNPNLFCSFGDSCGLGNNTCTVKQPVGGCCTINSECANGICDQTANTCMAATPVPTGVPPTPAPPTPVPTAGAGPKGSSCTSGSECISGVCSTTYPGCGTASCCDGRTGDPCAIAAECASGTCIAGACG